MDKASLIILGSVLLAGFLSIELGISVAILEILAGVIAYNIFHIDTHSVPWMEFLSNFGLLALMFFAGFETDGDLLKKHWKKSVAIGMSAYFIPLAGITVASLLLFSQLTLQTAILFSIGLSTTSLALVYAVLKSSGNLKKKEGQIILSSAMIIDIASMLSLTILFEGISLFTVVMAAIVVASLFYLPKAGKKIFQRYKNQQIELKSRFVMLALLTLFFVSENIGVHVAVLAFVLGFSFSELLQDDEILEEKLKGITFGFLAPLFFFSAGLTMDISQITRDDITKIAILTAVAYSIKFLSAYYPVKKLISKKASIGAGINFNYRLSFGIIVASFGLHEGYFDQSLYITILSVVIATSVISTVLSKFFAQSKAQFKRYRLRLFQGV